MFSLTLDKIPAGFCTRGSAKPSKKQLSYVGQSEGSPDKQGQNLVMKTGKCWKPMATITIQAGLFPPGPLKDVMEQEEITGTSKEMRHYLKMAFFSLKK